MSAFSIYLKQLLSADLASPELPDSYRADAVAEASRVWRETIVKRALVRRRVLLVGGGGYIGVPLAQHLLAAGYDVLNTDWSVYGHTMAAVSLLGQARYEFKRIDFTQTQAIEDILQSVTDVIILGGLVGDPITKKYPAESEATNGFGIRRLIDACSGRGLNKVIFISTCSNYGEIPQGALADEDYELKPLSLYAQAKVAQELHLKSIDVDFHWTVLRFATAFGLAPRMRFDLTVNQFTRELFLQLPLEVYDADTWRPYCHVRDFARALTRVLEAPLAAVDRRVFNAGGDANNFTKSMIAEAIKRRLPGATYSIVQGGTDRRNYKVNFARIKNTLYFEPHYSVEDGIDEILGALQLGYFADYDANRDYYGNFALSYPVTVG